MFRYAIPWLFVLTLGGCSLASLQSDKSEITHFGFNPTLAEAPATPSTEGKIVRLTTITAVPGADSRLMAYSLQPGQIDFFARNEWLDRPARLLEPLIIQALEGRDGVRAVITREAGAHPDLRLELTLERLLHRFDTEPSQVDVAIRMRLLSVPDGDLLISRQLTASEPAPSADPAGGVQATDRALARILSDLQQSVAGAVVEQP